MGQVKPEVPEGSLPRRGNLLTGAIGYRELGISTVFSALLLISLW